MRIVAFFFLVLYSIKGMACLNFYGEDAQGHVHDVNTEYFTIPIVTEASVKLQLNKAREQVKNADRTNSDYFKKVSDYAAWLSKAGQYAEALAIFQELNKKHPGEYTITANLGTLYELNGLNDSALFYIEKSVKINPNSHSGSEWVHINILNAKIKGTAALPNTFLLTEVQLEKQHGILNERGYQVKYQLNERIPFSKAGDLYVAKIFEELGDLFYNNVSIKYGYYYYTLANAYSLNSNAALQQKLASSKSKCITAEKNAKTKFVRKNGMQPFDKEIEKQRLKVLQQTPVVLKDITLLDAAYWKQ